MEVSVDHHTLYLNRFIKEYTPALTLTLRPDRCSTSRPASARVGQAFGVSKRVSLREIRVDLS